MVGSEPTRHITPPLSTASDLDIATFSAGCYADCGSIRVPRGGRSSLPLTAQRIRRECLEEVEEHPLAAVVYRRKCRLANASPVTYFDTDVTFDAKYIHQDLCEFIIRSQSELNNYHDILFIRMAILNGCL